MSLPSPPLTIASIAPSTLPPTSLPALSLSLSSKYLINNTISIIDPSILNSSNNNPSSFTDIIKSSWLLKRLFDSFTDAIIEQSNTLILNESSIPINRSKSMINYCISPFALFCMLTATLLNRVVIFASSRSNKKLPLASKIILRLLSLYLLFEGSYGLIVSLKLYANSSLLKSIIPAYFDFREDEFYKLSFLSMTYSSKYYEKLIIINESSTYKFHGPTPTIFKPFYLSLCLSQIFETFIAVTNGSDPYIEYGLTLFEYSLAFQEVQTAKKPSIELLIVGLIALVNQANIHILGLFNLQKFRLIPSFILGLFTLTFYFHVFANNRIFYIPFTIIIGYLPQLLTLVIILLSLSIFLIAGLLKGSLNDLLFNNLFSLNSLNISLDDDFYTLLIKLGSFVINTTSRQSYIKQFGDVQLPQKTFIESKGYNNELISNPEVVKFNNEKLKKNSKTWIVKNRSIKFFKLLSSFLNLLKNLIFKKRSNKSSASNTAIENISQFKEDRVLLSELTNDEIEEDYINLLLNSEFSETDDINDCEYELDEPNVGSDDEFYEFASESESEFEMINSNGGLGLSITEPRQSLTTLQTNNRINKKNEDKLTALNELITPNEFMDLINSKDNRILNYHMSHEGLITRSEFNKSDNNENSPMDNDERLLNLINSKRPTKIRSHELDDDDFDSFGLCVICHTNSRQIILWPCKCFAICEGCRMSLFVKNFNTCCCCRSPVDGYSKIYVP